MLSPPSQPCQTHPRYVPESKLLKSGKSYLIGRKSTCDLVVNHKKVSHDHGRFEVGGFSPDDVVRTPVLLSHPRASYPRLQTNVDYMPTLRILNSKNKTMRIWREGVVDGVIVNPSATELLQHNDKVDIVSGLPLMYVHACAPFPINSLLTHYFDCRSAACNGRDYAASKRPAKSEPPFPSTAARLSVCRDTTPSLPCLPFSLIPLRNTCRANAAP